MAAQDPVDNLSIVYWNIKDLSAKKAVKWKDKIIPTVADNDLTFLLEVRGNEAHRDNLNRIISKIKNQYSKPYEGAIIDAADTTGRKESYMVFWNKHKFHDVQVRLLTSADYTAAKTFEPAGRSPLMVDADGKRFACLHALAPNNKIENRQAILKHLSVAQNLGVSVFGGDFNIEFNSRTNGRKRLIDDYWKVAKSDRPTTRGGNKYDYIFNSPDTTVKEITALDAPGISDHRAVRAELLYAADGGVAEAPNTSEN